MAADTLNPCSLASCYSLRLLPAPLGPNKSSTTMDKKSSLVMMMNKKKNLYNNVISHPGGMQEGHPQKMASRAQQTQKSEEEGIISSICYDGSAYDGSAGGVPTIKNDVIGRGISMKEIIGQQQQQDCEIPSKFQVPMFQGRYCWTETQWQTMLMDAATGPSSTSQHFLGRLTFIDQEEPFRHHSSATAEEEEKVPFLDRHDQKERRSVILDGQQQFITVTLLLASIRDALWKRQQRMALLNKNGKEEQIVEAINRILFLDHHQSDYRHLISSSSSSSAAAAFELKDGIVLPFAKLIPAYCDRWSYYSAILPPHWNIKNRLEASAAQTWHRPLEAKKYFDAMVSTFSNQEIWQLYKGVMDNLTMALFVVDFNGGNIIDESEQVLVERLDLRNAAFGKSESDGYFTMNGLAMIRNDLLGAFGEQAKALEFYQSYWLPMERMAASSSTACSTTEDQQKREERFMTSMMNAFLDQEFQSLNAEEEKIEEGTEGGGLLYARFLLWQDMVAITTKKQGGAILAFAQGYFEA